MCRSALHLCCYCNTLARSHVADTPTSMRCAMQSSGSLVHSLRRSHSLRSYVLFVLSLEGNSPCSALTCLVPCSYPLEPRVTSTAVQVRTTSLYSVHQHILAPIPKVITPGPGVQFVVDMAGSWYGQITLCSWRAFRVMNNSN